MTGLARAPNTFLMFWTAAQLRDWVRELRYRARRPAIWKHPGVPTLAQTTAELKRRHLTMTPGRKA